MASFKDTLLSTQGMVSVESVAQPVTLEADDEIYTMDSTKYAYYPDYSDSDYSLVDITKTVKVNASQVNITQEENSQVIPFELNRFWDGVDLTTMKFRVYFINAKGDYGFSNPINFSYSSTRIRFYWLVDKLVTAYTGKIQFEIQANGTNQHGDNYIWKTRPNKNEIDVLECLKGNEVIKPSDSWYTQFVEEMDAKIRQADTAAQDAHRAAQEASQTASTVDNKIASVESTIKNQVLSDMSTELTKYYTKEQVDQLFKDQDFSSVLEEVQTKIDAIDGLANLKVEYDSTTNTMTFKNGDSIIVSHTLATNPSAEWTTAFRNSMKSDIDTAMQSVKTELNTYKSSNDAEISKIKDSVDTIKGSYVTQENLTEAIKNKAEKTELSSLKTSITKLESSTGTNTSNISAMGTKISELEKKVDSIDTTPTKEYDVDYDEEHRFTFYEIENGESTVKKSFVISGGGGGSVDTTIVKIGYITTSPVIVTKNDKVVIKYNFSSVDSSGDVTDVGTATWKVGNTAVATSTAVQGDNSFDITDYVSIGTQKITLTIVDSAGTVASKTWTVQILDVRLESTFNDQFTYPVNEPVSFTYTPYGSISKTIHFILDGKELSSVTSSASGLPQTYEIDAQSHGAHLLESYITAEINGVQIESNHIFKDIIWYDGSLDTPVIGCVSKDLTVKQYDTTNITYVVYDPRTETPTVTLAVDGKTVSTLTLSSNTAIWQYKTVLLGKHVLTITCRNTVKTINVTVEELGIDISPITANLAFDFNPVGKSNDDADRLWEKMTVSDNFDWVNGGYQIDSSGDQYFGIKSGTYATINYNLFADDARKNGKEFKLVFMTENVRQSNATFLTCEAESIGLQMNVHEAYIKSNVKSLYIPYSEEDIIEFEFNINKDTDIPIVMSYEDGTPYRPMSYTSDYSFTQSSPVPIKIGSPDCDVRIYRVKAYTSSLSDSAILSNFIADARNADEMVSRYKRNQIYDENNQLTPESVAEACPNLRVLKLEAPYFTKSKKDFVKDTSVECIYKGGDPVLDNWKFLNCYHAGQGTTSDAYGAAGRNLDIICCADGVHQINSKIPLDTGYVTKLTMGDGSVNTAGKVSLTRNSVANNWFNIKVNIASSENVNNAYLANRYQKYLPYSTPASRRDPKTKTTMEFVNCVVFVKESDPDLSTHREFQDTEWHFYGIGNLGDSKKTDLTRAYDPDDMHEFCIEVSDNTLPNSIFQTGITDSKGKMTYPITKDQWKSGNEAYDALYNNWDGSFEFRYDCCGDSKDGSALSTDAIKEEIRTKNRQIWRDFYEWVITSSNEDFVAHLKDWFIEEAALYFYLFTSRYIMIDNRAKNVFYHWAKIYISTEEATSMGEKSKYYIIDDNAAAIHDGYRFDFWDYDNDSALGINNSGELSLTYGKEDFDYRTEGDSNSGYVFNAAENVFFCRIRDLMRSELRKMYNTCESSNCWSASSLINQFDEMQNEWCEELWRIDFVRKYDRPYRAGNTRYLEEMFNGKKKYQRRQFERDQEIYIATEWESASISDNQIMFRCNTPKTATVTPDYTLHITPFQDMYLDVVFGNSDVKQIRAKAGQEYAITCPYQTMDDTAVLIYAASKIQSLGDISRCYIHDNDFSKATKLRVLIIGNESEGYSNVFLTHLVIGNNPLLETLDLRGTPSLTETLNLTGCSELKELYADTSGLTGVTFANGGKIATAHLPAITAISMKNLSYLTDLQIQSLENLKTLVIENTAIDSYKYVNSSPVITNVRLIGIDWDAKDTVILDRLRSLAGIDNSGYNTDVAVLAGKFHTAVMRQKLLDIYNNLWPDLAITYDTLVEQFTVTFRNDDGSILDVQYVDKGGSAVDPLTREENPISIPKKESTVSTDYTYSGWDSNLNNIFADRIITATYSESVRNYTVKYIARGKVRQETKAPYGSLVLYKGSIPVYTDEENAYVYYLFSGWDSSGYVNGDKTINAVYDRFEYTDGCFDNLDISEMTPVQLYALTKVAKAQSVAQLKDSVKLSMGNDYSYSDIQEKVLIGTPTVFIGTNYVDTGIKLLQEDSSWTLAIDYRWDSGNATNAVLAQCYQGDGSTGFRLWNSTQPRISWATSSGYVAAAGKRDIIVLRHIKGETKLHVYKGNLPELEVNYSTLSATRVTANSTLVFGCSKADDGAYENHAKGTIFWSKLWYADMGDDVCRELAAWTHEDITMEMAGFKRFYLSDNSGQRSSMTFLASHLLSNTIALNTTTSTTGGWASFSLNQFLNSRFYNAIPVQWKQLIKQVKISSSVGDQSTEVSASNCYIAIPAIYELDGAMNFEPYSYEGSPVSYITSDATRLRKFDGGKANAYWTRSPNASYQNYVWQINADGSENGYQYALYESGILIMFSI